MPMGENTGITISKDTRNKLRKDKPDGVTWDYYLLDLKERANE